MQCAKTKTGLVARYCWKSFSPVFINRIILDLYISHSIFLSKGLFPWCYCLQCTHSGYMVLYVRVHVCGPFIPKQLPNLSALNLYTWRRKHNMEYRIPGNQCEWLLLVML